MARNKRRTEFKYIRVRKTIERRHHKCNYTDGEER